MTENNKIDFETIDYSKVNPKKLNGNKRIVKSYLIYFAFDVVLTVAIFLLTLFKLIDSSDNTVNTVIFILSVCAFMLIIIINRKIGDSMRAFVLIRLQN